LPGGDVALLRKIVEHDTYVEIVKKAIIWPARQIAINSGKDGHLYCSPNQYPGRCQRPEAAHTAWRQLSPLVAPFSQPIRTIIMGKTATTKIRVWATPIVSRRARNSRCESPFVELVGDAQSGICAGLISSGGEIGFADGSAGSTELLNSPLLSGCACDELPWSGTGPISGSRAGAAVSGTCERPCSGGLIEPGLVKAAAG